MRKDALYSLALERDHSDSLRSFRARFDLPGDILYMDGNSLGALPKETKAKLAYAVDHDWGQRLVRAWNESWVDLPHRLGAKIASLIGADPDEVVVCDSTSVNFYKLLSAAVTLQKGRGKAVTERISFPSNRYILQKFFPRGVLDYVDAADGVHVWPESVEKRLDETCAVLCLNHVNFRSGWLHDMRRLNLAAGKLGILNLWDLSHSVGVVPINLHDAKADLAVGCTYKYLNGGPGSPAFLYVRREFQSKLRSPIQGWFGTRDFFEFDEDYEPENDIRRFLAGTPNILSMVGAEPGIDLALEAGMDAIRAKSIALTEFLLQVYDECLAREGVRLNSPREAEHRGSHVSLGHDRALGIDAALIQRMGVIPDFRKPDNIRFGLSPLYNRFVDVYEALERTRLVLANGSYEAFSRGAGAVT